MLGRKTCAWPREYRIICRGHKVRLHPLGPYTLSRQQLISLSQSSLLSPVELSEGRGGRGRLGAESYDRRRALPSINHSILSGMAPYLLSPSRGRLRSNMPLTLPFSYHFFALCTEEVKCGCINAIKEGKCHPFF
jgi:hypothetical protein